MKLILIDPSMSKFVVTQKNTKETLDYVTMPDDEEKKKLHAK